MSWQIGFGLVVDFDDDVVLVVVGLTLEVEVVVDGDVDGVKFCEEIVESFGLVALLSPPRPCAGCHLG